MSYANFIAYTMDDIPLALRSCSLLRHIPAYCGMLRRHAAPRDTTPGVNTA